MALVTCPECGHQVSTDAVSCPHCGKILSRVAAVSGSGGIVFAPGTAAPATEQLVWAGSPSVALVYGKALRLIIRTVILIAIGYVVINNVLPAISSISADMRHLLEERGGAILLGIVGVLAIAAAPPVMALFGAIADIKNTHYKVTNQRIVVERGVLSKSLEEIDMRSVEDTEFHQSFVERLFGIGEVWIVSTDKVAPRMVLHGIREPRNTRELIRTTAYQVSQRQLFTRAT